MYKSDFSELEKDFKLLIWKIIGNKNIDGYTKEDLYQECLMILHKCNQDYDEGRGAKFITHFYTSVRNMLSDLIRKQERMKRPDIIYVDYDSHLLLSLVGHENNEEKENLQLFNDLIKELASYEKGYISYDILINNVTKSELANVLGLSKQRIGQIHKRNIEKLKKFYSEKYLLS